jgi:hypothetical protein
MLESPSLHFQEYDMTNPRLLAIAAIAAFALAPSLAMADGNGAVTGAVGGAVTGAVVGGPVGAVVGGAVGAIVGNSVTTQPNQVVLQPVQVAPVDPCNTSTTRTSDNSGNSQVTQTTSCPN